MEKEGVRQAITDALRYWEPRRLAYNGVLVLVVLTCFFWRYPASKIALSVDSLLFLFVLAVLANVAYCAAYVPDVFAQLSGFRDQWQRYRWIVFVIGLLFAGVLARFWVVAMVGDIPPVPH